MATVGEFIDLQRKRLRVTLILSVVLMLVATTIINRSQHGAGSIWWILPPGLAALSAVWWVARKMICPRCHRGLMHLAMVDMNRPIRRCPFCAADFGRPMA